MHQANADHAGGDVHVAHRHPGAPDRAAHHILGRERHQDDDSQHQQVFPHRCVENVTKNHHLLRGDHAGGAEVGEPAELGQRPHHEELRRQGRHRQIEALDAQAGQAEHDTHQRRHDPGEHEAHQDGHARNTQHEIVGGERSHRHERRRTKGQLPGITGEDVEAQRRQRKNEKRDQNRAQPVLVADDGHDQKGEQQDESDPDAVLADRKDLLVGGVRVLELPGVAIEHISGRQGVRGK